MKYVSLIVLFVGVVSAMAAGQENRGPAYCRNANIVCTTSQDLTQSTDVCIFTKFSFAVVFPNSDGKLYSFQNVVLVPVAPGVYGAGATYSGDGFNLHMNTDVPPTSAGIPSNLTTPSLNFSNLDMNCVEKGQ